MKAMIYTGPKSLELGDVPAPTAAKGEALVRVNACGICGSDMHAWLGHDERRPAPLVLGHEVAGIVEGGTLDGKRVTVNPLVECGTCKFCKQGRENLCSNRQILSMPPRQGGFSQYVTVPESNLVVVPDDYPLLKAALCEPLACGWHAVRLSQYTLFSPLSDVRCLVIGGGAIGTGAALSLRAMGARDISILETNAARRKQIFETTDFAMLDSTEHEQSAYELVIDAVGYSATRKIAFEAVEPGGVITHIGLGDREGGMDVRRATLQEITFIGTYTYTNQDFRETAQAMFDGRLGNLDWIETRPLEDGPQSFFDISEARASSPKIVLQMDV